MCRKEVKKEIDKLKCSKAAVLDGTTKIVEVISLGDVPRRKEVS